MFDQDEFARRLAAARQDPAAIAALADEVATGAEVWLADLRAAGSVLALERRALADAEEREARQKYQAEVSAKAARARAIQGRLVAALPGALDAPRRMSAKMGEGALADLLVLLEREGLKGDAILSNAADHAIICRLWAKDMKQEQDGALLKAGWLATIWGLPVLVSRHVPRGRVLAIAEGLADGQDEFAVLTY